MGPAAITTRTITRLPARATPSTGESGGLDSVKAAQASAELSFRLEQQGLAPRDLVPLLGSRSRVSEVLSGRRGLSLKMIRALVAGLRIPAELLLGEPGRA